MAELTFVLLWNFLFVLIQLSVFHCWSDRMWWWLWTMNSTISLSNHLTYQYYDIGRVDLMWIAHIRRYTFNQGAKSGFWPLAKPNLYSLITVKWFVVTILKPIYQSQPCLTIHYTYYERFDGFSWYEMAESASICSILVWNVGAMHQNFHHPWLKSRGVVRVLEDEFQSPPSPTIHYTYNDTLEGLGCCELYELVSTHTIWVRKVRMGQAKFVPSQSWKIGSCGDHFSAHIPISITFNHSSYLWRVIGRVEMLWIGWIILHTINVGVKHRAPMFAKFISYLLRG